MADYLLKNGADIHGTIGKFGDNAVDISEKNGFVEIKKLLERYGGKTTVQTTKRIMKK